MIFAQKIKRINISTVSADVWLNGEQALLTWSCLNKHNEKLENDYTLTPNVGAKSPAVKQHLIDVIRSGDEAGPHQELYESLSRVIEAKDVPHKIHVSKVGPGSTKGYVNVIASIDECVFELDLQLPLTSDSTHKVVKGHYDSLSEHLYTMVGHQVEHAHTRIQRAAYTHGFEDFAYIETESHCLLYDLNRIDNVVAFKRYKRMTSSKHHNSRIYEEDTVKSNQLIAEFRAIQGRELYTAS